MEEKYDFGLVGLGVMGRNFILNVADNGFSAYGHDLDPEKVAALKEERNKERFLRTSRTASLILLSAPTDCSNEMWSSKIWDCLLSTKSIVLASDTKNGSNSFGLRSMS